MAYVFPQQSEHENECVGRFKGMGSFFNIVNIMGRINTCDIHLKMPTYHIVETAKGINVWGGVFD